MISFGGFLIAASLMGLLRPKNLKAQAPPGPLAPPPQYQAPAPSQPRPARKSPQPQMPPRTTLAGPWRLNRDQSDDPRQKIRDAERSPNDNTGGYPGGGYPGGGYPGGGYPGGYPGGGYPGGGYPGGYPGGGYPGGGRRGPSGGNGQDIEDNPKMQPLLYAPQSITVDLKDAEVDVTDDRLNKLILYTDGRKLQKSSDTNQEVAAHWSGSQLVSDEKSPLSGKMTRTFALSADGRNLDETLQIENGRSSTIFIRYVYDITSAGTQSDADSDPDRPVLKRSTDDSSGSQSQGSQSQGDSDPDRPTLKRSTSDDSGSSTQ
jgi:hypothetical protein